MRSLTIPGVAVLVACAGKQSPSVPPPATSAGNLGPPRGQVTYRCDGGAQIQATYSGNAVSIHWNGRAYPLALDPVVPGDTVYRRGNLEWRRNGRKAGLVESGRRVATGCEPMTS